MSATYILGDNLYVNLTNQCTCNCDFCIRRTTDHVATSGSLWHNGDEPSREQVLEEIRSHDLPTFDEIVFCGFGEPTCRLDDLLWICRELKRKHVKNPIRVNTNGHACLIAGKDVCRAFKRRVDAISISLNGADPYKYESRVHSRFGTVGFFGMLDFAASVKYYVKKVEFTIVDTMPEEEQKACEDLAAAMEIPLRVRHYRKNYDGEEEQA